MSNSAHVTQVLSTLIENANYLLEHKDAISKKLVIHSNETSTNLNTSTSNASSGLIKSPSSNEEAGRRQRSASIETYNFINNNTMSSTNITANGSLSPRSNLGVPSLPSTPSSPS